MGLWVILILPLALYLPPARIFQNRLYLGIIEKKQSYKIDKRKLHVKDLENSELTHIYFAHKEAKNYTYHLLHKVNTKYKMNL